MDDFEFGNFVRLGFQANPNILKDDLDEEQMHKLMNTPIPNVFSGLTANACQCIINLAKKFNNQDVTKRMRLVRNTLLKEMHGSQPMTCVNCEISQGVVMFTPCHHMCICVECYLKMRPIKKCVICNTLIEYVVKDNRIGKAYRKN